VGKTRATIASFHEKINTKRERKFNQTKQEQQKHNMARLSNNSNIMLILGLALASTLAHASKLLNIESSSEIEISSNEYNDDNNNNNKHMNNRNGDEQMPVNDQISVLSKRLEILTEHRQEDYRMLERSLRANVEKHFHDYINVDIKKELKDLR
jgi:hypothetical protein